MRRRMRRAGWTGGRRHQLEPSGHLQLRTGSCDQSHPDVATVTARRLSVAVVVDDISNVDADGTSACASAPEEIERLTDLVREAVGFDTRRGDSVRVLTARS